MTQQQPYALERDRTAIVIMDYQVGIVANYASDPEGVDRKSTRLHSSH